MWPRGPGDLLDSAADGDRGSAGNWLSLQLVAHLSTFPDCSGPQGLSSRVMGWGVGVGGGTNADQISAAC